MIVIPDARTADLYAQWSRVSARTDPAEAEPLALDCVRRLVAEPGGQSAHVWVAGLAEMVRLAHLDHLYAPSEFAAPEGAYPVGAWACTSLLADWARDAVVPMDERYEEMDEQDDDDGSISH
ncbi:hypothetical protein WKI68_03190 [Streptomyces sp. MS1.HAVA.3]|uniref:Uncharacterized protein n=1 Tax=Streptomyces caledonius TaxID=3134107 RepID=A0ABU8TYN7_9ACTN